MSGCRLKVEALHSDASALSAFRILPSGEGRAYSVVEASRGWLGLERLLRMARAVGYIAPPCSAGYAVLDVYDDDDSIIQDFTIPTARAFRWWKRKLGLRVER